MWHRFQLLQWALAPLVLGISETAFAQCDQTLSAGENVASAVSGVAAGGTVCLNAGSYPAFNSTVTKTRMTTVTAAPGVGQSQVTIAFVDVGASQYLTFSNMTIGGATVGTGTTPALHIALTGIRFTGPVCVINPTDVNQDTLIDSSTFAGLGVSCTEGRLGITGNNRNHSVASGIVISRNVFGPGGCSDGIQINGGARGVHIVNNEFTGIKQGSCSPAHVDPIQFYGAVGVVVRGNYFHDNSTGIMSPDCNGSHLTVVSNVFVTDGEYPDQIVQSGPNAGTFDHNTFGLGARMRFGNPNGCGLATGVTLTNNIVTGGLSLSNGQSINDFSMSNNMGVGGWNAIPGTATYVGGTSPTSWAGWRLTDVRLERTPLPMAWMSGQSPSGPGLRARLGRQTCGCRTDRCSAGCWSDPKDPVNALPPANLGVQRRVHRHRILTS